MKRGRGLLNLAAYRLTAQKKFPGWTSGPAARGFFVHSYTRTRTKDFTNFAATVEGACSRRQRDGAQLGDHQPDVDAPPKKTLQARALPLSGRVDHRTGEHAPETLKRAFSALLWNKQ